MRRVPSATRLPLPRRLATTAATVAAALVLGGCAIPGRMAEPQGLGPTEAREAILRVLPEKLDDRAGWAADIHAALATLELPSTPENLCAVMAVTEQESGYRADPEVPNLPKIARDEIDRRADAIGIPSLVVRAALALRSGDGRSYAERLDAVRTERELSELYEDFIDRVPLGRRLLAGHNPVRTGGPMQVGIEFAESHATRRPYPYPVAQSIRREVFTRHGGLYFGTAHLLDYEATYDRMIYRFADFNAGPYASRNAALQHAIATASGVGLALDGDLLPGPGASGPGQTERAAYALADRIGMRETAIRRDLERANAAGLERSPTWQRVFAHADRVAGKALPRAVVPRIDLKSPKFTRKLTTAWFADRVEGRWRRCVERAAAGG
jgi:hypothetical protein